MQTCWWIRTLNYSTLLKKPVAVLCRTLREIVPLFERVFPVSPWRTSKSAPCTDLKRRTLTGSLVVPPWEPDGSVYGRTVKQSPVSNKGCKWNPFGSEEPFIMEWTVKEPILILSIWKGKKTHLIRPCLFESIQLSRLKRNDSWTNLFHWFKQPFLVYIPIPLPHQKAPSKHTSLSSKPNSSEVPHENDQKENF